MKSRFLSSTSTLLSFKLQDTSSWLLTDTGSPVLPNWTLSPPLTLTPLLTFVFLMSAFPISHYVGKSDCLLLTLNSQSGSVIILFTYHYDSLKLPHTLRNFFPDLRVILLYSTILIASRVSLLDYKYVKLFHYLKPFNGFPVPTESNSHAFCMVSKIFSDQTILSPLFFSFSFTYSFLHLCLM